MKKEKVKRDERVKRRLFPVCTFFAALIFFALFTTLQMKLIGKYIDYTGIPVPVRMMVLVVWILVAMALTLWLSFQIGKYYQKPVEEFSEAARRVASGDFSVHLTPRHTKDKANHLDVLFTDFNAMVEELGSVETLKTDFLSNVSYEIKAPLEIIQDRAELLEKRGLTEGQRREYTETVHQAANKLSALIDNMLTLNKLEKLAVKPVPRWYDLCAQLCECALQFVDVLEQKNIAFEANLEDRALIQADAELLAMVWTNLLSNAVKFTPPGGALTLEQITDGDAVMVTVSDTGCGMDPDTMRRIFDKFYQGDTSHATEGGGLGLALVRRILEMSGGTISVTSALGQGSVFTVRLPVSMDSVEDV